MRVYTQMNMRVYTQMKRQSSSKLYKHACLHSNEKTK